LKEKMLAAHRAGIRTIIVPKDNQKDLADIPEDIRDEFAIHCVESMDEVLKVALTAPLVPLPEDGEQNGDFQPPIGNAGNAVSDSDPPDSSRARNKRMTFPRIENLKSLFAVAPTVANPVY